MQLDMTKGKPLPVILQFTIPWKRLPGLLTVKWKKP